MFRKAELQASIESQFLLSAAPPFGGFVTRQYDNQNYAILFPMASQPATGKQSSSLMNLYQNCRLCPRACSVDRFVSLGRCGESAQLRLAFAGLHSGEEPSLIGEYGSGTIFVSGCGLGCSMCQNWQISSGGRVDGQQAARALGQAVSTDDFAALCLELQKRGAENINIVTGSHAGPAIALGLDAAKNAGLQIPVVWNSSGYETVASLELLDGCIDIWLPDLKTLDSDLAARFFDAPDYPQAAVEAIRWMIAGSRTQKVIIRHMILPGQLESTRMVLRWFADTVADKAADKVQLSLMSQYTPITANENSGGPGRFLLRQEYETVIEWLKEFGIDDGFCQEFVIGNDWLPDFRRNNPFSSKLSVPVWPSG